MNKAPSFTSRDLYHDNPSPTISTRRKPSTYAPSVAESIASVPSTTSTSNPRRKRPETGGIRAEIPRAISPDFDSVGQYRVVIGIDYGTTFTGISWVAVDNDRVDLDEIQCLRKWGTGMENDVKIPSVISYSLPSNDEEQFGADISPDAITMVNTKLELDPQDERVEELDLILQSLKGMSDLKFEHVKSTRSFPGYTWKGPEEVATDYLTKAFEKFEDATDYLIELKSTIPIDIVITIPVRWSYRAKNSTLRAVRNAGFNETNLPNLDRFLLVTEPEAAALYTAEYFKQNDDLLRERECFVLVDAGGGTVDVVAYKVKQIEPSLQLEAITIPTGAKCGSSFINANFKTWLQKALGDHDYRKLDPAANNQKINAQAMETSSMRKLMKSFDEKKKTFSQHVDDIKIELPAPLDTLTRGKVDQGTLTITYDEMCSFFDPCVDNVIELIDGQIAQVTVRRNRVKSIFLVGGFSESKYLQEALAESINRLRMLKIRLPETSWSAVVQGAALFGMVKTSRQTQATVKHCPRSYGVAISRPYTKRLHTVEDEEMNPVTNQSQAKGQLSWFIRKGDLLQMKEPRTFQEELYWHFVEGQNRNVSLPIYEYLDDDVPMRFENSHEELKTVGTLTADLGSISLPEMEKFNNPVTGTPFYQICLICQWTVTGATLKGELWWGEQVLNTLVIQDIDQL